MEAAEYCANLLEASQMVPMHEPPTAKIQYWRSQPPEQRDQAAIRKFALDLGRILAVPLGSVLTFDTRASVLA